MIFTLRISKAHQKRYHAGPQSGCLRDEVADTPTRRIHTFSPAGQSKGKLDFISRGK